MGVPFRSTDTGVIGTTGRLFIKPLSGLGSITSGALCSSLTKLRQHAVPTLTAEVARATAAQRPMEHGSVVAAFLAQAQRLTRMNPSRLSEGSCSLHFMLCDRVLFSLVLLTTQVEKLTDWWNTRQVLDLHGSLMILLRFSRDVDRPNATQLFSS